MKKKVILLVLLSVLLCVFAASALADYTGVQLWDGGPEYATTTLEDPFGDKIYIWSIDDPLYNVRTQDEYPVEQIIPKGWHIASSSEFADLFDQNKVSYEYESSTSSYIITGKDNQHLTLGPTGYIESPGVPVPDDINTGYYFTSDGQCMYFDATTDPYNVSTYYNGQVILVRDPHTHAYQFTASGDTITATCANCPNPNEAELTLTISGKAENDYSGHPVTPVTMTLAGNTSTWKGLTGEDLPKIAYYNGDTLLTEAPTDVGTYTAKISVGSVTASKEFKINRKSVAISVNPTITPNNATYTGEPITFTVTATEHGEDLVPGKDFEIMGWKSHPDNYTATTLKVTDVTDHAYITFSGIGNYKDNYMLTYEVVPKPISESPVTVTVTPEKATYTGSPIEFTVTAKNGDKDLKAGTDFKIRSFKSDASPDKISGTDVAGYFITVEGLGNYSGSVDLIGNIVPKPITITPDNQTIVKGDPLPTLTWTSGDKDLDDELKNTLSFSTTAPHDDNDISTTAGKDFKIFIEEQDKYIGFSYEVTYGEGNLTVLDIFTVTFDTNGGGDIPSQDVVEG